MWVLFLFYLSGPVTMEEQHFFTEDQCEQVDALYVDSKEIYAHGCYFKEGEK